MVSMVTPYYILVSFAFGYILSLYPGKRNEKHEQSSAELFYSRKYYKFPRLVQLNAIIVT